MWPQVEALCSGWGPSGGSRLEPEAGIALWAAVTPKQCLFPLFGVGLLGKIGAGLFPGRLAQADGQAGPCRSGRQRSLKTRPAGSWCFAHRAQTAVGRHVQYLGSGATPDLALHTSPAYSATHIRSRAHTHTHTYGYCVCGFLAPRASGLTWPAWKRFPSCLNLLHHLSSYRTGVGRSRVSLGDRGRGQERTRPWRAGLLAHLPESPLSPPSLCSRLSFHCRPSTPPSSRNSHPAPLWGPWPPCWVCSPSSLLLS